MTSHVTHRGVTADSPDPIRWVLTLHSDGTARLARRSHA